MIPHISYSQFNTHTQCPRSWYLGKQRRAEEKQTWYLPIGSAVHDMIEAYLDNEQVPKPSSSSAEIFFYPLILRQMAIEPDTSKWLAGGPKTAPITEDLALQQVKDCFEKAIDFLEEIEVWEVEYDASGNLPGLEVPVKAFVDIVGEHKKHGPTIVDWKTGSNKPKNNFQLETYRALTVETFPDLKSGLWAMLKPGASVARKIDLTDVDPAAVGAKYQEVYLQMTKKIYEAKPGFNCRFCFYQDSCLANAGPTKQAKYYDLSAEEGYLY